MVTGPIDDANLRALKAALRRAILRVHQLDRHLLPFPDCQLSECVEARRLLQA